MTLGLMSADEEQRLRDGGVSWSWGAQERLFATLDSERSAHRETLANFDRAASAAAEATNELGVALRRAETAETDADAAETAEAEAQRRVAALEVLLDAERAAHRNTREYADCRLADAKAAWEGIALSWKERALAAEEDAETRCRILQEALQEMLAAFSMGGALNVDGMRRRTEAKKAAREAIAKAEGRP